MDPREKPGNTGRQERGGEEEEEEGKGEGVASDEESSPDPTVHCAVKDQARKESFQGKGKAGGSNKLLRGVAREERSLWWGSGTVVDQSTVLSLSPLFLQGRTTHSFTSLTSTS